MKHNVAREMWSDRVRRWKASGLTLDAFAAREGCNAYTLRNWGKKLNCASALPTPRQASFVEIVDPRVHARAQAAAAFEVTLANGVRISVPQRFERSALDALLAAVCGHR